MQSFKFLLIIMLAAFTFTSCKKDDKKNDNSTPVGYFKGTFTNGEPAAQNIFFLIRENNTCRQYYGAISNTDSANMSKEENIWVNNAGSFEISRRNQSGYIFRATLIIPITKIEGIEGLNSLGTFQAHGSFSVVRQ